MRGTATRAGSATPAAAWVAGTGVWMLAPCEDARSDEPAGRVDAPNRSERSRGNASANPATTTSATAKAAQTRVLRRLGRRCLGGDVGSGTRP